jgi:hypothetical protein
MPVIMLISTALLLDSIIRNSVCTPAKLPCRPVEVGYENVSNLLKTFFSKILSKKSLNLLCRLILKKITFLRIAI